MAEIDGNLLALVDVDKADRQTGVLKLAGECIIGLWPGLVTFGAATMADNFDVVDKTFSEIKRLAAAVPFQPFQLQVNGKALSVDHPNSIAFHPEVPYLTIHTRTDIYKIAVADVSLIRESYTS